jgi:hypothetical protein
MSKNTNIIGYAVACVAFCLNTVIYAVLTRNTLRMSFSWESAITVEDVGKGRRFGRKRMTMIECLWKVCLSDTRHGR